jgi:hypothetical protein
MIGNPQISDQVRHENQRDSLVMFNIGVPVKTVRDAPGHQGEFQITRRKRIV